MSALSVSLSQSVVQDASQIPALKHRDAAALATTELERFLALVSNLKEDDWHKPTYCTLWDVRHILAHQAGCYAGFASWAEFKHQMSGSSKPAPGQLQVDLLNSIQVGDRADKTPAELIAELREVGPKAIRTRQRLPFLLRAVPFPFGPPLGTVSIGYLTDMIYSRDTWMHRIDICRATGREMVMTPEHDGRLLALVVRDLAKALRPHLHNQSVIFELTGAAGGTYQIGKGGAAATIRMDMLDLNVLASGRITAQDALAQGWITIAGDKTLAHRVLELTNVPY